MGEKTQTYTLTWQDITVEITHVSNWLNGSHDHIALRAACPLPVTNTGYRSLFVPHDSMADVSDIPAFVQDWLDEAAQSKAWQQQVEASRQLSLF